MGLWQVSSGKAYRIREFYHDGRQSTKLMTDEEYYRSMEALAEDLPIEYVVVDPSAASFIETIRRHGKFAVKKAKNNVTDGIRFTAGLISTNARSSPYSVAFLTNKSVIIIITILPFYKYYILYLLI